MSPEERHLGVGVGRRRRLKTALMGGAVRGSSIYVQEATDRDAMVHRRWDAGLLLMHVGYVIIGRVVRSFAPVAVKWFVA